MSRKWQQFTGLFMVKILLSLYLRKIFQLELSKIFWHPCAADLMDKLWSWTLNFLCEPTAIKLTALTLRGSTFFKRHCRHNNNLAIKHLVQQMLHRRRPQSIIEPVKSTPNPPSPRPQALSPVFLSRGTDEDRVMARSHSSERSRGTADNAAP